jgi:shikimate dehydrogenase
MDIPVSKRHIAVGLIGSGIQFSSSPAVHMAEGAALGFDYSYELLDLDLIAGGAAALPRVLAEAEQRGFAGVNVTYPCKQGIVPLLHELSLEAELLQSVNTVVFRDGRRFGHNSDWWGFAESFRHGLPGVSLQDVALIGAGGAGSAVGFAALRLGAQRLSIFDTNAARAAELAERMTRLFPDRKVAASKTLDGALLNATGLIHATPMGMQKLPGLPVPARLLRPEMWVAEIVYVPLETQLLQVARANGCRTLAGNGMTVYQAAMSLELFCGAKPDTARMLRGFTSKLATVAD